jgi:nanoRNase/pAp phosphatase (c-di-AMP/oligoRNAs hydrolase)
VHKLLGINLIPFDPALDLSQYAAAGFVDNQGTTSGQIVEALEAAKVHTLSVVDHHAAQDRLNATFSEIRRTGATGTIYAEYLRAGLLELDRSYHERQVGATALLPGRRLRAGDFVPATSTAPTRKTFRPGPS